MVTAVTTAISARSLQLKQGLPFATQVIAWACLATCLVFPFVYGFRRAITVKRDQATSAEIMVRQPSSQRLAIVIFAFAPVFVLLSLRDEVLFFGCYTVTLLVWAKMEGSLHELRSEGQGTIETKKLLQLSELRVSLFYLFFLHVGFFGTGNVASISSFYLSPVYRLVPIFNPFLMATLLLLKILVPFLILNAVFSLLATTRPLPPFATTSKMTIERGFKLCGDTAPGGLGLDSALSLVFGAGIAGMYLRSTFCLRSRAKEGSWLEIGQTITHFVMANLLQIFMLALAAASSAIIGQS